MHIKTLIQNKNNLFLSWMISYGIILIVPIIIASFTYAISIDIIEEEINKAHSASLEQIKSIVDGKIQEIDRLSSEFSLNQKLRLLMYSKEPMESKDVFGIIEVQKDLAKYKISNNFIDDIYIHLNNKNIIFSDTKKYGQDEFEYMSDQYLRMDSKRLMSFLNGNQFRDYRIIKKEREDGQTEKKIIVFQSLYLTNYKSPEATLIIVIDGGEFARLLQNVEWISDNNILVVNNQNEFIGIGDIPSLPDSLNYESLDNKDMTFYQSLMKDEMAITHVKSNYIPWEYVSMIPLKVFQQKIGYIKKLIYLYIGLCLVVGLIIAYIFTKKNYSSVRNLTQLFINRLGKSAKREGNEFTFLESSLKSLLDENESAVTKLKQQNETMRNNLFYRLVKGRINGISNLQESFKSYGIRFQTDYFVVMIFSIDDLSKCFSSSHTQEDEETTNLIHFIIKNVIDESLGEKHVGYMAEIDGRMICIVNVDNNDNDSACKELIQEDMIQAARKSIDFIEQNFEIYLSVAISEVHSGIRKISQAYSEALEVIEYKILFEEQNKIMHYGTIDSSDQHSISQSYSLEKEKQFINCILAEDYKNAGEILDNMIINDFSKQSQSLQIVKCRMFGLINSMLNAMGEIQTELDVEFFDALDPVNRLLNAKSIIELKKQVKYILEQVNDYYSSKTEEQLPSWLMEVMDFVKVHYLEPDLTIGNIAEEFNFSNSYLSRTFKKYMGFGLLDYIHRIRIEEVKLLMNSDLSIKEIAEKVGYTESNTMIRAFKRYEGVTPGQFREKE